jgi:transcriptional regulator with XRE-family HTH domain
MRNINEFLAEAFKNSPKSIEIESKLLFSISNMIFSKRKSLKMSQKEFAKYLGVSQGMISKWESCEYNYSVELISKIAEKLAVTPDLKFKDCMSDNGNTIWTNNQTESNEKFVDTGCVQQILMAG